LAALPEKDRQRLLASCETVELGVADVLGNPGDPISHVYFPTGSVISLVLPVDGSTGLEVALIGNEGMLGITLILGVDIAPFQALTQGQVLRCAQRRNRFSVSSNRILHCSGR
jgi:hypothetical protein